jgi:hypothetical protein
MTVSPPLDSVSVSRVLEFGKSVSINLQALPDAKQKPLKVILASTRNNALAAQFIKFSLSYGIGIQRVEYCEDQFLSAVGTKIGLVASNAQLDISNTGTLVTHNCFISASISRTENVENNDNILASQVISAIANVALLNIGAGVLHSCAIVTMPAFTKAFRVATYGAELNGGTFLELGKIPGSNLWQVTGGWNRLNALNALEVATDWVIPSRTTSGLAIAIPENDYARVEFRI